MSRIPYRSGKMGAMGDRTQAVREFEESVLRASERYEKRRRALEGMERRAREDAGYALSAARRLSRQAEHHRDRSRRELRERFGLEVSSGTGDAAIAYETVKPERAPKDSRERLNRAETVMEHAEAEVVYRAVWSAWSLVPGQREWMACKLEEAIAEAMGFSPALWFDKSDGHQAPDAALMALLEDETARQILGEVLRMPPKNRDLLLGIARQISPPRGNT